MDRLASYDQFVGKFGLKQENNKRNKTSNKET
jgi:hypothetical protein